MIKVHLQNGNVLYWNTRFITRAHWTANREGAQSLYVIFMDGGDAEITDRLKDDVAKVSKKEMARIMKLMDAMVK